MVRNTRHIKDILWIIALSGLVAGVFRLWFGLGATTNLSDAMPWGLWKVLNMVGGVALSTSGFTVGLLVYVLRLERFREVFWCVMLYFTVTAIELLPTIIERFRAEKIIRWLHRIAFGVVVTGISLSSLHHSSLGSLFLVTPTRLHPLWYSSLLPVFFILSAMGGGIMVVVLVRILYARWYDPEPVFGPDRARIMGRTCVISNPLVAVKPQVERGKAMSSLSQLAAIAVSIMGVYFILKIADLIRLGTWRAFTAGSWESWLYGFELLIAVVLPIILVAIPKTRRSPAGLGIAAFSTATGLILNRLDVGIFGYFHNSQTIYFPSLAEWAVGIGVIAAAGLTLLFIAENFAVFDENWRERRILREKFRPGFDSVSGVWGTALSDNLHRVTLIAVFIIPIAWVLLYPPFSSARISTVTVLPSAGTDPARTMLRIDGNRAGVLTNFPHIEHQKRLGGDSSCVTCHHVSLPKDNSTPCSRCHRSMVKSTLIFDHVAHLSHATIQEKLTGLHPENHSCTVCHVPNQPKKTSNAKPCLECHNKDIWRDTAPVNDRDPMYACGFSQAMHSTCVTCHAREAVNLNKKGLDDCATCHASLKSKGVPSGTEQLAMEAASL
jgi:Ni/Fe-hydrogenase subunit HybB-like protein